LDLKLKKLSKKKWHFSLRSKSSSTSVKFFLWTAITNFDQKCPADLPGRARQTCPADLSGRLARQTCPADLPGRLARQSCPAVLLWQGSPAMTCKPWLWQSSVIMNKCRIMWPCVTLETVKLLARKDQIDIFQSCWLKFRYFCQIFNYRELSIIFARIIDNSIIKKSPKLSIIDNDNFR
jgi:hypothetical protein